MDDDIEDLDEVPRVGWTQVVGTNQILTNVNGLCIGVAQIKLECNRLRLRVIRF